MHCIPRTKAARLRNAAKKRAAKLIKKLNNWKLKAVVKNSEDDSEHEGEIDDDTEYITLDDFLKGLFPWQLSEEKGFSHPYFILKRCPIIIFILF